MITRVGVEEMRRASRRVSTRQTRVSAPHRVEEVLQGYATRGVFRSFSRTGDEFRFHWLWNLPFHMTYRRGSILFPALLTEVERGSELETALTEFIRGCCSPARPLHRRIDAARLSILYSNRRGAVTLRVRSRDRDDGYAAASAIRLVNEIFLS